MTFFLVIVIVSNYTAKLLIKISYHEKVKKRTYLSIGKKLK